MVPPCAQSQPTGVITTTTPTAVTAGNCTGHPRIFGTFRRPMVLSYSHSPYCAYCFFAFERRRTGLPANQPLLWTGPHAAITTCSTTSVGACVTRHRTSSVIRQGGGREFGRDCRPAQPAPAGGDIHCGGQLSQRARTVTDAKSPAVSRRLVDRLCQHTQPDRLCASRNPSRIVRVNTKERRDSNCRTAGRLVRTAPLINTDNCRLPGCRITSQCCGRPRVANGILF